MSDLDDELANTPINVDHHFAIEINVLVKQNHQLTLDGLVKKEEYEVAETRQSLTGEDHDLIESQVRWQQGWYDEMRIAANHLALVGLVTRFQHWIKEFAHEKQLGDSGLIKNLTALNNKLGEEGLREEPPVPLLFFEGLVNARDSVIHADSKAEWEYNNRQRGIPNDYRKYDELELTEDQLNEAIGKAIQQVKWYAERLPAPKSVRILGGRSR